MSELLHWFKFWAQPKSIPQAVVHGCIGGAVFCIFVFAPFWVSLLEVLHG